MICLGLTGGIGSGKTFVAEVFTQIGIPVYNADKKARELSENSPVIKEKIIQLFGREAYPGDHLNSRLIGSLVFQDQELLKKLNAIVHPAVEYDFLEWCKGRSSFPYLLKEAAILFETGIYKKLDATILVIAPEKTRIERIKSRDGLEEDQIRQRLENQWSDEEKLKLADFVINNDGRTMILPQVLKVHQTIIKP